MKTKTVLFGIIPNYNLVKDKGFDTFFLNQQLQQLQSEQEQQQQLQLQLANTESLTSAQLQQYYNQQGISQPGGFYNQQQQQQPATMMYQGYDGVPTAATTVATSVGYGLDENSGVLISNQGNNSGNLNGGAEDLPHQE